MRTPCLVLSLGLAVLACHGQATDTVTDPARTEAKDMPPAQLTQLLGSPNVHVFDCNEEDMYAEAHVPGARLIVYDQVTADKLPVDKNATLVFYCYNPECPASHSAAESAIKLGYRNVFFMLAGITGWQDAGLPTEP